MKHELLAPAGNLDIFYAVVNAGADAVYVGGPRFGARAYAKNFTTEELVEAITYAHLHNVKVYMTVNTLVKENERMDCVEMMIPFYEAGLDGVILQDMGVFRSFRHHFPDMELHASTQMSVSNVEGAKLLKNAGIVRVVPSRELSLSEIKRIHEEAEIEIESFIHGALCYCYSGQCLLSSFIGGRSGNRGRCAQPCRLPYAVYNANMQKVKEAGPILSLKDLCTIAFLPELLEAGIYSLKIEGRMKQASYAYTVVSIYRKYLDYYETHGKEGYQVSKKDYETLLLAGNRDGFTDGYYHRHNGKDMLTSDSSSHSSSEGMQDEAQICEKKKVALDGYCTLQVGKPASLTIESRGRKVTVYGDEVQLATSKGMDEQQIVKQLSKTGNSEFEWEHIRVDMDENIFIPVSKLNQLRREAFGAITRELISQRIYTPIKEDDDNMMPTTCEECVSVLIRTLSQLDVVMNKSYIQRVYIEITTFTKEEESSLLAKMKEGRERGISFYVAMPFIFRKKNEEEFAKQWSVFAPYADGLLARSYDSLAYAQTLGVSVIADASLYVMNNEAIRAFKEYGVSQSTFSVELRRQEMEGFYSNNAECIVYGRIPMMISAGCICKNTSKCEKKPSFLYLKDRKGYVFPVRNECRGCYNVVYNSTPTCLFAKKGCIDIKRMRLQFSIENADEVRMVLRLFEQNVLGMGKADELSDFTWGHYKRGVE